MVRHSYGGDLGTVSFWEQAQGQQAVTDFNLYIIPYSPSNYLCTD